MNKTEYLLTCLIEECAEVQQACTKAIRFGLDNDLDGKLPPIRDCLHAELNDVEAVLHLLYTEGCLRIPSWKENNEARQKKEEKVHKYMELSRNLGTLDKNNLV